MKKRFVAIVMALTLVLATGSPMSLLAENTSKQVADNQQAEMILPEKETDTKETDNKKTGETEVVKPEKQTYNQMLVGDLDAVATEITDESSEAVTITANSPYQVYKFIPEETKKYYFFSDTEGYYDEEEDDWIGDDPFVRLYQGEEYSETGYTELGDPYDWDDEGGERDFFGSYELMRDESYYFLISLYDDGAMEAFDFYLSSTCTNAEEFAFAGKEVDSRTITNLPQYMWYDYERYDIIPANMSLQGMCINFKFKDGTQYTREIFGYDCGTLYDKEDEEKVIGTTFTIYGDTYNVYWKNVKYDEDYQCWFMDENAQGNELCIDINGEAYGKYPVQIKENPVESISLSSPFYSNNKVFVSDFDSWYNPLNMDEFVLTVTNTDGTTYDLKWEDGDLTGYGDMDVDTNISYRLETNNNGYYILGDNTLTVNYAGKSATFDVYLYGLDRFEVIAPVTTTFDVYPHEINSDPVLKGLKLKAYLTDGTTENIEVTQDQSYFVWKDNDYQAFLSDGNILFGYQSGAALDDPDGDINRYCDVGQYNYKSYSSYPGLKAIDLGVAQSVTLTQQSPYVIFSYTPNISGVYRFYSFDNGNSESYLDTYTCLYDNEGFIDRNDDSDEEDVETYIRRNFSLNTELQAGRTYYFMASTYNYIDEEEIVTGTYKCMLVPEKLLTQTIVAPASISKYSTDAPFALGAKISGNGKISYASSNPAVATVDGNGIVTPKMAGTTVITVSAAATPAYAAASKQITLTVTDVANYIYVKDSFTKTYGAKAFNLRATSAGKMTYTSSNKKVATVDKKGKVTIKKCGKAIITIKSKKSGCADFTQKVVINVVPKKATIKSVKSKKAGQLTVTWKKQAEAKGYIIEYSTDKKFQTDVKTVKVSKNKTTSKMIKKLKKGKKYYVRVKAYVTIDKEAVTGAASKTKNAKVKK